VSAQFLDSSDKERKALNAKMRSGDMTVSNKEVAKARSASHLLRLCLRTTCEPSASSPFSTISSPINPEASIPVLRQKLEEHFNNYYPLTPK
jgi:hypothetical protein